MDDYNQTTADRRAQFEALKSKDQESARIIEEQTSKLTKLQETAAQLKQKIFNTHQDCEERNKSLRKEKESVQHHFQMMKHKIGSYRGDERKKLARLAVVGKQVVKSFKNRVEKAEDILKQMALTRKLETEGEKVIVYEDHDDSIMNDPELKKEVRVSSFCLGFGFISIVYSWKPRNSKSQPTYRPIFSSYPHPHKQPSAAFTSVTIRRH